MNFFEKQEQARKQSRWLILAFTGVTLLIIAVIALITLVFTSYFVPITSNITGMQAHSVENILSIENIKQHSNILILTGSITAAVIGIASLFKITTLSSGGARVAVNLGGTLVTGDTHDPLRKRLYNIVEEISIASGIPVPDVFILENEPGINAFAAGHSPSDAAVAVTQGAIERLNRAELQGVIAHEFSHIFNGDMRLNIRLMGILFGIMVVAIIGRKFIYASHIQRSSRNNNALSVIAIGGVLMLVGYIGLFFARMIKSALSRQREFLADASAVQFTRDPSGIAGALKKIAAYNHASYLVTDTEEVGHMLFGSGMRALMFETHPPLEQRIERIEKRFNASEITELAKKLKQEDQRKHSQASDAAKEQLNKNNKKKNTNFLDVDEIISNIGDPSTNRIAAASLFSESLSENLKHAARSIEWSPEVLIYTLMDTNNDLRDKQLMIVLQEMGDISEGKVRHLISSNDLIDIEERLPVFEIAFPSIKRRPLIELEKLLSTIEKLSRVDQNIDSFEFLLSRLIRQYLFESATPNKAKLHGKKKLVDHVDELTLVVSILAAHGQNANSSQGLQYAQRAFKAGMSSAGIKHKNLSFTEGWQQKLDEALTKLDRLTEKDKEKVVRALATTVLDDKKLITEEQEMMRVISAILHVPVPILQAAE